MNSKPFVLLPLLAVAFSALIATSVHAQTAPGKTVVSGKFLGDGKDGKIQYLVVQTTEPFSDKPAIKLVFTEKNPTKSKKPDFDAAFKELGSALILSVFKDGGIFGCEVAHTAHEKSPFTALGQIKITDFTVTDTQVSGHVITPGELDAFGQKWEVDLTFSSPLPKGAFADVSEPAPEPKKADKEMTSAGKGKTEPATTTPQLPVGQLPLPSAARDVEFKAVVKQIAFSADASVSVVANDFSAKLKQQGWKEGPGNLMGKNNAILKRQRDGAELTIMVQPAGKGCTVKIFTEGLDWSDPPASAAATPAKSGEGNGIDAETNQLIKDALKQLPKGF